MRQMSTTYFDHGIAIVTLPESENMLKLRPYISLIQLTDSEIAMASNVNTRVVAICDDLQPQSLSLW
jgi:hypothetical protein